MTQAQRRTLREQINTALAGDGQRLKLTCIIQTHAEVGPMLLPCKPYVVERGIDLEALGQRLGVTGA